MELLVALKTAPFNERLPAGRAGERLLSRVRPHVDVEVAFPPECLPTGGAGVRSFSRVRPHVARQSVPLAKRFAAKGAVERFLSRVDGHVGAEVVSLSESLAARLAAKRFVRYVVASVSLQSHGVFELFPTLWATVSLLTCVYLLIRFHFLINYIDNFTFTARLSRRCGFSIAVVSLRLCELTIWLKMFR